jgi:hypothetical protein
MCSTHNQLHVVCGSFTKFAVYHHLQATVSQHCQHYEGNTWSISINTHAKPKITNTELTNNGYGQIALLQ